MTERATEQTTPTGQVPPVTDADGFDPEPEPEQLEFGTVPEAAADPGAQPETPAESETDAGSDPDPEVPAEPEEPTYQVLDCTGADVTDAAETAREAVERGECVVLPTDTVYGIGADAFSADAVQRLLDAKRRGRDMPPPVLIADAALVRAFSTDVPQAARDLMAAHWPGALTVILTAMSSLTVDLGETDGTIALRVPDHPLARELLRRTGPLAVSSANTTGQPAALDVEQAIGMLGNAVSVYLDGGTLGEPGALPSTMVDFTRSETGHVLRVGAISVETLRETVPELKGPPRPRAVQSAADLAAAINAAGEAPPPAPAEPETESAPTTTEPGGPATSDA